MCFGVNFAKGYIEKVDMKLALIGYGKMGKAVAQIAMQRGHQVVAKIDKIEDISLVKGADCCIEFTAPHAAYKNLKFCIENNIPVVCGTTGWYDAYDELKDLVLEKKGALLTATNFSIGVNMFFKVNSVLANMMNNFNEYDITMEEIHHLQKIDHPSGTGISLAQGIVSNIDRINSYKGYLEGEQVDPNNTEVAILCKREPDIPGTHTIKYESDIDEIVITHRAKSRTGFATGAVVAAEWLLKNKGVFTMKDVLGL